VDFIWLLVYWLVFLSAIYVSYRCVREVEQVLVRRPLSIVLNLATVLVGTGLLLAAFNLVTNNYILANTSYLTYYNQSAWPEVISVGLALGAGFIIARDVQVRLGQGNCPQCGTPLLGNAVCTSCTWGRLPVFANLVSIVHRGVRTLGQQRIAAPSAAPTGAPSVPEMSPTAPAAGVDGSVIQAESSVCTKCGNPLATGQTICGQCGNPVDEKPA
jgi:hypothetical protein